MTRPGDRLRSVLARCCRPETMAKLVDPVITDFQLEYEEALRQGRRLRAVAIRAGGCIALVKAGVLSGLARAVAPLEATPADRPIVVRAVVLSIVATLAFQMLLMFSAARFVGARAEAPWLLLYLAPQAVPVSVAVGFALGVLLAIGRDGASARVRRLMVGLALVVSIVSLAMLGWGVPAGNQAFRESVARQMGMVQPSRKGLAELTIGELASELRAGAAQGRPYRSQFAGAYFLRWQLPAAPLALVAVVIAITTRRRSWFQLATRGSVMIVSYYGAMLVFERLVSLGWFGAGQAGLILAAVAMNATFVVLGVLVARALSRSAATT